MTDDGVPVPINTAPKSQYGASTATNGHWLHDLAGPAQYVPAPQDCGKAIAPDLQKAPQAELGSMIIKGPTPSTRALRNRVASGGDG